MNVECLHPERCGSDGTDCCHPRCIWSPENIHLRLNIVAARLLTKPPEAPTPEQT